MYKNEDLNRIFTMKID